MGIRYNIDQKGLFPPSSLGFVDICASRDCSSFSGMMPLPSIGTAEPKISASVSTYNNTISYSAHT